MNLRDRLVSFLANFESAECIDDLQMTAEQKRAKKADYFFNNREVICEFKTINADPFYKIENEVHALQKREEWPVLLGTRNLSSMLGRFSDAPEIKRRMNLSVTNLVEESIRDANNQIRSTKNSFSLPNSEGLLVFLNDKIHLLNPQLLAFRIGNALTKLNDQRQPRFPFLNAVLVVDTAHVIREPNNLAFSIFGMSNPNCHSDSMVSFVNRLVSDWCRSEGAIHNAKNWGKMDFEFINVSEVD